ncbi:hypothetical protein ACFQ1I_41105 [Kitasatospora arboriphila]
MSGCGLRHGEAYAVNIDNVVADDVHRVTEQVNRTTKHYAPLKHRAAATTATSRSRPAPGRASRGTPTRTAPWTATSRATRRTSRGRSSTTPSTTRRVPRPGSCSPRRGPRSTPSPCCSRGSSAVPLHVRVTEAPADASVIR